MKTVELAEATATLAEYVEEAGGETVVVTREGYPLAAVVPVEGYDLETLSLSTNPDFLQIIEHSRARCPPDSGISSEEMKQRLAARRAAV